MPSRLQKKETRSVIYASGQSCSATHTFGAVVTFNCGVAHAHLLISNKSSSQVKQETWIAVEGIVGILDESKQERCSTGSRRIRGAHSERSVIAKFFADKPDRQSASGKWCADSQTLASRAVDAGRVRAHSPLWIARIPRRGSPLRRSGLAPLGGVTRAGQVGPAVVPGAQSAARIARRRTVSPSVLCFTPLRDPPSALCFRIRTR